MVGAALGYPVELVMAANVSRERKRIIEAFGAKAIYSDPLEGSDGAIVLCRKIHRRESRALLQARPVQQRGQSAGAFRNHRPRDLAADRGRGHPFRRRDRHQRHHHGHRPLSEVAQPAIKVIAVEPDDPMHGLEGLKHMASSIVPGIYHESELDDKIAVIDRRRLRDGLRARPDRRNAGRPVVGGGDGGGAEGRARAARRHAW